MAKLLVVEDDIELNGTLCTYLGTFEHEAKARTEAANERLAKAKKK